MTLILARRAAACLPLFWLALPAPAWPDPASTHRTPPQRSAASAAAGLDRYSPRARRLVAHILRLRLLELREAGLDRARAVVEGRLPVDALLRPAGETTTPRARIPP